jgi:hypothetical protein
MSQAGPLIPTDSQGARCRLVYRFYMFSTCVHTRTGPARFAGIPLELGEISISRGSYEHKWAYILHRNHMSRRFDSCHRTSGVTLYQGAPGSKFSKAPLLEVPKAQVEHRICTSFLVGQGMLNRNIFESRLSEMPFPGLWEEILQNLQGLPGSPGPSP